MTPEQIAQAEAGTAEMEAKLHAINTEFDAMRVRYKQEAAELTKRRDHLATLLKAERAGLGHLIKPAGIESQSSVGTPGA